MEIPREHLQDCQCRGERNGRLGNRGQCFYTKTTKNIIFDFNKNGGITFFTTRNGENNEVIMSLIFIKYVISQNLKVYVYYFLSNRSVYQIVCD